MKKTFKKYATIKWTKNNEPWDPKSDGKAKFNGFQIRYELTLAFSFILFSLKDRITHMVFTNGLFSHVLGMVN